MFANGTKVRLAGGDTAVIYTVQSNERHNGLLFYRLAELAGALFLPTSLEAA